MSRNVLLIAAGVLMIAAAVIYSLGSLPPSGPPEVADHDGAAPTHAPAEPPPVMGDALVPPIEIAGLAPLNLVPPGQHNHGDGREPISFNPFSVQARIMSHADFTKDLRASFEPHGEEICASGCAATRHPTKELTKEYFHQLLRDFAGQPMDETSFALESLCYFGRQSFLLLEEEGDHPLDPLRSAFLRRELRRNHATVEVRVVDEFGETRSWLPPTRVPLDRRHVFDMEVADVQPLVTSGTVKRVGLYHLWNRL